MNDYVNYFVILDLVVRDFLTKTKWKRFFCKEQNASHMTLSGWWINTKIELTDDELQVLVDTGDMDKDGKIGIEDFRSLSNITFKKSDEK